MLNNLVWTDKLFRTGRLRRKVLVIGDESALGFGDYVIATQTPGMAKHLQEEIRSHEDVRFKWRAYSAYHICSTSEEWLPTCDTKPKALSWTQLWSGKGKNLFEQTFREGARHGDCEAVILNLGVHDTGADAESTARNLVAIAEELVRRGKRVWINTLPTRGHLETGNAKRGWLLAERNTAIRRAVQKAHAAHGHIYLGADLETYKRDELFCFDGVHLSSRGYRRIAKELYPLMKNPLINIEWLCLRPELSDKLKEKGNPFMAAEVLKMGTPPTQ